MIDLDAIEARANAATPGPWTTGIADGQLVIRDVFDDHVTDGAASSDAAFIAAARADIPALIARVRDLEAALRSIEDLASEIEYAPGILFISRSKASKGGGK